MESIRLGQYTNKMIEEGFDRMAAFEGDTYGSMPLTAQDLQTYGFRKGHIITMLEEIAKYRSKFLKLNSYFFYFLLFLFFYFFFLFFFILLGPGNKSWFVQQL